MLIALSRATQRFVFIDYLRGLAALSVAWYHITGQLPLGTFARTSGAYGRLGVEVFFVISGFVIPNSFEALSNSEAPRRRFLVRRICRVELPYIASIILFLSLWYASANTPGFAGKPPDFGLIDLIMHIFYLVPFTSKPWIQLPYWTLAYEFTFYLLIAVFYTHTLSHGKLRYSFVAISIELLSVIGVISPYWMLFLMGLTIYRSFAFGDRLTTTIPVIAGAYFVMIYRGQDLEGFVGIVTSLFLTIGRDWKVPGPIGKLGSWLGTISYSLYLTHVPIGSRIVSLGKRIGATEAFLDLVAIISVVGTVSFAWAFWKWIERPAQVYAKGLYNTEAVKIEVCNG